MNDKILKRFATVRLYDLTAIAGVLMGGVVSALFLAIPIVAIWTTHQRKLVELQQKSGNQQDQELARSLEALRKEVATLRDTSMSYDVSFDNALQRVEGRMTNLEQRVRQVEQEVKEVDTATIRSV